MRWCLVSLLLAYICNREGFASDGTECFLAFLLAGKLAAGGGKLGVAVDGGEYPVRFGNEVVDFLLAVYDEGKGRGLHPADAEHLSVLTVFQCVKSGGVHAENPVADGAGKSGKIERLIFPLVFQFLESLLDGFIGHGRNPQSLDRAFCLRLLHHPSLDKLSFLSGVTAVDDAVGSLHQFLDGSKLLLDAFIVDELDAETLWNHRQRRKAPMFPHRSIIIRFLQLTKVAEGPCYLVTITFHITVACRGSPDDSGDILSHTRFLCYTNYHVLFLFLFAKVQ